MRYVSVFSGVEAASLAFGQLGWDPVCFCDVEYRGKPAPDTKRYKAIGNSMAVPVMKWIGEV